MSVCAVGHLCAAVLRGRRGNVSDFLELSYKWYKNGCWEQNSGLLESNPGTHSVHQTGLELRTQRSCLSLSPVLVLKVPPLPSSQELLTAELSL